MKVEEIRNLFHWDINEIDSQLLRDRPDVLLALMAKEIAAQLAEINQHLRER
jgi:hypothetical protein